MNFAACGTLVLLSIAFAGGAGMISGFLLRLQQRERAEQADDDLRNGNGSNNAETNGGPPRPPDPPEGE